jgi:hypothetical protein
MKHLLLTTIAAVVLVGCGESNPMKKNPRQDMLEDYIFSWLPTWVWMSALGFAILLSWGKYLRKMVKK